MSAKTNSHLRVRMLCEGAMMVALAQVLSYIKLMELPNGGSLTPAMFPILLFAVRWGLAPGNDSGSVLAVTLPLSAPITDTVRG